MKLFLFVLLLFAQNETLKSMNCDVEECYNTCGKGSVSLITEQSKHKIVQTLNSYRSSIAKGILGFKAANMKELVWHDELEIKARCSAWLCSKTIPSDACLYSSVGDSIHPIYEVVDLSKNSDQIYNVMEGWYEEFKNTKFTKKEMLLKSPDKVPNTFIIGVAYTQYVGCGIMKTKKMIYIHCNFHPVYDATKDVFVIGEPCTRCTLINKCRNHLLCDFGASHMNDANTLFGKNEEVTAKLLVIFAIINFMV